MKTWSLLCLGFALSLLAGCERARGEGPDPGIASSRAALRETPNNPVAESAARADAIRTVEAPRLESLPLESQKLRRVTRTIDKDPDGDGIANRRIVITEIFDASGVLVQRIREEDFEADGIVDARTVSSFEE